MSEEILQTKEMAPKQEMTSVDVVNLYLELDNLDIKVWIDGGWGVDALLGKQTRLHKDLDIAIQAKDVVKMRELLEARGYKEIKIEIARPHNFILGNGKGHEIDVHVVVIDDKGNGIYGPPENGQMYPADGLKGTGTIDGQAVRCIAPECVVKFHSGYELKDKDFQDVRAVCKKFGIELPEEYSNKSRI